MPSTVPAAADAGPPLGEEDNTTNKLGDEPTNEEIEAAVMNEAMTADTTETLEDAATAVYNAATQSDDLPPPPHPPPLPPVKTAEGEEEEEAAEELDADMATNNDDDAPLMSLKSKKPTYYAVRVGYAAPSSEDRAAVSTIRSAIFLQWEDVQNFVKFNSHSAAQQQVVNEEGVRITPFHHNVEYKEYDNIERAERYLKKVMPAFANGGGDLVGSKKKSSSSKVTAKKAGKTKGKRSAKGELVYPPPKNFNPPTKKWELMFATALQYKETHEGSLYIPTNEDDPNYNPEHEELIKWIKYQRSSYRYYLEDPMGGRHSMTEEKVNRLKDAGFTWIVSDKKAWLAEESSMKKRGRGRPKKLKQMKEEKEQKPRQKWLSMYAKLVEYKRQHNTIEISSDETDEELLSLRTWCKNQKNMHSRWRQGHDVGFTQEKANMLSQIGMDFPLSWEDMYVKVVQYKAQNGDIDISTNFDPILAAWMTRQNEILGRHLQGKSTRLTDDQAMRLMALGFQGGKNGFITNAGTGVAVGTGGFVNVMGKTVASRDFDAKWDEMLLKLRAYKEEHGDCNVTSSSGTELAHWVSAQRRMYNKLVAGKPGKRSVLDASKMQRLTEIGFQFRPRGSYQQWDDQMTKIQAFVEEKGHCRIPVADPTLGSFVKMVRRDYKNWVNGKPSAMTPEREAQLKQYGFIFEGGKTPQRMVGPNKTWDERLEELTQYKAEFGHTVVPQNSGQLGAWVHSQRVQYKKYKEGLKSQMTAEKALKLTEAGFCFNASDRYRGNKRHKPDEQEVEEQQVMLLDQQREQHQMGGPQQAHYAQHLQDVHVPIQAGFQQLYHQGV